MDMLKVFTAFSGYDSQCLALDRLIETHGLAYELVGWSEIDKYAIQAHNVLFPQWAKRNYGDISKIDWSNVPDFDLFTYSFPCTDISAAGVQKGLAKGRHTQLAAMGVRKSNRDEASEVLPNGECKGINAEEVHAISAGVVQSHGKARIYEL